MMKRFMYVGTVVKVACLAMCLVTVSFAQASVAGEWDAAMETPSGSAAQYKVTLKAAGETLSGMIKGSRGEYPLQGTLKGKDIKLSYTTYYNDNALIITIAGTVEGDTIKAVADIGNGNFQGPWMAKRVSGASTAASTVAPAAAQASGGVNGEWDVTMNTPQGQQSFRAVLRAEGEVLKGELRRGNAPQGLPVTGTVKGNEVIFGYSVKYQDMDLKITMNGTLAGDAMKGQVDFGGFIQDEWSGKRAAAGSSPTAAPSPVVSANDLTGTWNAEVETAQGSGSPTFVLKQEGEKLSGSYKGMLGEFPLTGTIKGDKLEFSFTAAGQVEGKVTYVGTVSGATMKGTVIFAALGEGTWKAVKK